MIVWLDTIARPPTRFGRHFVRVFWSWSRRLTDNNWRRTLVEPYAEAARHARMRPYQGQHAFVCGLAFPGNEGATISGYTPAKAQSHRQFNADIVERVPDYQGPNTAQ